jgi:hypothetical protein
MEEPTPTPSEPGADLFDRWLAHRERGSTPPQPRTPADDRPEPAPEPAAEPEPVRPATIVSAPPENGADETSAGRRRGRRSSLFGRRRAADESSSAATRMDLREFEVMVQAERAPVALPEAPIPELDLPPAPEALDSAPQTKPRRGRRRSAPQPVEQPLAEVDVREFEQMVLAESLARVAEEPPTEPVEPVEVDETDHAAEEALLRTEREADAARSAEEARLQAEREAEAVRIAEAARLQAQRDAEAARRKAGEEAEAARVAHEARLQAERDAEAARLQAQQDAEAARVAEEARLRAEREAEAARVKAQQEADAARAAEEARLRAERDAEAARLAARLAEEARAGAVGSGHAVLAAFAAASATTAAPSPVPSPAPSSVAEAPERLSWSTGSPLSRLSRRRKQAEPAVTAPKPLDEAHEVLAAFAAAKPTPTRQQPVAAPATPAPAPRVTLVSRRPEADTSPPQTKPPVEATTVAPPPAEKPVPQPARSPAASRNVTFKPKRTARRVVGLLLLAAVAATAYAGYLAYDAQTPEAIGVAGGLGLLSLVLWAIRAGTSVSTLSVTNGQLEIRNASGRFVFDLASPYMPIEVVGTPGKRKWKVLFIRRSMEPFTIDSSMVDPVEFMAVLREYRPERAAA